MGNVVNLNRFRKKKAKEVKEKKAETNRRLHGRTMAERALQDADKKLIEDKLDGAFLVRESVTMDDVPQGDLPGDFDLLEAATRGALTLGELTGREHAKSDISGRETSTLPPRDPTISKDES